MCSAFSDDYPADHADVPTFEQIHAMVGTEFDVKESFVDHDIPTFYIEYKEDSKEAFLRLMQQLEPLELVPLLRKNEETVVLRIMAKPPIKPSRNIINVALFFVTLGTVFISGYIISNTETTGALLFTGAIMAILGSHEMGHKLLADKHDVEATYPYFIPSPPPPFGIGTFGAVIRQKAIPPNRNALFDIGFTGPITGFIVAAIVAIIGLQMSTYIAPDLNAEYISTPLLFQIIIRFFPPSGAGGAIHLHPLAFAGWVGMVVTMLNLVPSGMFDGGHVARSLMDDRAHQIISYVGIIFLVLIGWWAMAILALFFSAAKHPGPLDDVSKLTNNRKIGAIVLLAVFILSVVPM